MDARKHGSLEIEFQSPICRGRRCNFMTGLLLNHRFGVSVPYLSGQSLQCQHHDSQSSAAGFSPLFVRAGVAMVAARCSPG